jgi:hypothetical protein
MLVEVTIFYDRGTEVHPAPRQDHKGTAGIVDAWLDTSQLEASGSCQPPSESMLRPIIGLHGRPFKKKVLQRLMFLIGFLIVEF